MHLMLFMALKLQYLVIISAGVTKSLAIITSTDTKTLN